MPFLPGQSGNLNGRPKKYDLRSKIIEEYVAANQHNILKALDILFSEVKKRKPWAVKEYLSYTIAKPTTSISTTSTELSEKRVIVYDALSGLSDEAKQALYDLMTKKQSEPVTLEAEVVDES